MSSLHDEIDQAADRLRAWKGAQPWKDHPKPLHLALYAADELSRRVRSQLEEHLSRCDACFRLSSSAKASPTNFKTESL
jgi:hypothetical protein